MLLVFRLSGVYSKGAIATILWTPPAKEDRNVLFCVWTRTSQKLYHRPYDHNGNCKLRGKDILRPKNKPPTTQPPFVSSRELQSSKSA